MMILFAPLFALGALASARASADSKTTTDIVAAYAFAVAEALLQQNAQ